MTITLCLSGFVMVRKILEVKEVTRIEAEAVLAASLEKSTGVPPLELD
jgi:hypothetical protein